MNAADPFIEVANRRIGKPETPDNGSWFTYIIIGILVLLVLLTLIWSWAKSDKPTVVPVAPGNALNPPGANSDPNIVVVPAVPH